MENFEIYPTNHNSVKIFGILCCVFWFLQIYSMNPDVCHFLMSLSRYNHYGPFSNNINNLHPNFKHWQLM